MMRLTVSTAAKTEMDKIGKMVYNSDLWGMNFLTIKKPSDEVMTIIKYLGYEIEDLNEDIRIKW